MSLLGKFLNYASYQSSGWNVSTLTSSGEKVSVNSSLQIGAVFAAIQIRANAIAKLPLFAYQQTDTGRKRATGHQVSYLLETRPNKYQTPFQFKFAMEVQRLSYGVAYIRMEVDRRGQVMGLHLLNSQYVTVVLDDSGNVYFTEQIGPGNASVNVYSHDELIVLPLFSVNSYEFKSPIAVARENIGLIQAQNAYMSSFYSNGSVGSGIIKLPQTLNKDAKQKVREAWEASNTSSANNHRVMVLDAGMEYTPISLPIKDLEYIASAKFQVNEIARIFSVPLHMLQAMESSTFNNIEQMSMDFISSAVQPSCIAIEEELNFKLFTKKEILDGYYVKFNMTSALRGDSQSRSAYYKTMIESGIFSINDVRALEEMDAISNGDQHRVSLNFINLDKADEYQQTKANGGAKGGE